MANALGVNTERVEAPDKVTGDARYLADHAEPGALHGAMVTSPHAHAAIVSIDFSEAARAPGVVAVVTGRDYPHRTGPVIEDRPAMAIDEARYFGEPVAVVVANTEADARNAANLVKVEYRLLPVVHSVWDALNEGATLIHPNLGEYTCVTNDVHPEPGSNVANHLRIRKGDMQRGWAESEVVIEQNVSLPQNDHAALETRAAKVQIKPDGRVIVHSTTQGPVMVKTMISRYFHVDLGKIIVETPLVGGAYGGKTPVQLELIAFLASRAAGGRMVKIANTRAEDIATSPVQIGFEGHVKLGARRDGTITAAEMTYLIDCGAYSDSGAIMTKAISANGTGPYNFENVQSDTLCVYTNHTFVTAFRGFGHTAYTFAIEKALDKMALYLGLDPLELRLKNATVPGKTTPAQVKLTVSNLGNVRACFERLRTLIGWDQGSRRESGNGKVTAWGLSGFWKTSSSPVDAISGVLLTFNADGTINLNCGAVECGQGTKTGVAQILAERMGMNADQIHVVMDVNTQTSPEHWKTVASMSTYMVGRAVLEAADDLLKQLRSIAGIALRCPPEDLEVSGGHVYLRDDPDINLEFKDIVHGFKYPNGNSIGGQIMGRGSFIMRHLSPPDPKTGKGKSGPAWTVGAQGVQVELDTRMYTYRILRAATVLDAGRVINPMLAWGQVTGAMKMGLSYGSREALVYSHDGELLTTSFRTYKTIRYGEQPEYLVEFIETPDLTAPYGERGLGEEGILGMPAALANALSSAAGADLNRLPLTPESIWRTKGGAGGS